MVPVDARVATNGEVMRALCNWLVFSKAADHEDSRTLWRDTLQATIQLGLYTAGTALYLRRGTKATIKRQLDSVINLVAALQWLDPQDKVCIAKELHSIQQAIDETLSK